MKHKRPLLFISICPLLISGCFSYVGNVVAFKNGDIAFGEINSNNAYRYVDYEMLDNLITSNSEFIFYLSSTTCSSCQEFEPIMVDYIKNSTQLVYKMNADKQQEDFEKLYNNYSDYFNGLSYTPGIYIFGDGVGGYQISNSRISNLNMFTTAMKEKLYESNVYSVSKYSVLDSYLSNHEKSYVLFYDRSNKQYSEYYNSMLKEEVNQFKKELLVVELSLLTDEDLENVKNLLDIDEIEPLMYVRMDAKEVFNHVATNIDEIRHTLELS